MLENYELTEGEHLEGTTNQIIDAEVLYRPEAIDLQLFTRGEADDLLEGINIPPQYEPQRPNRI